MSSTIERKRAKARARAARAAMSAAEEAAINAGIAQDSDNPEWTAADFKRARPAAEVFPEIVAAWRKRRGRGPQKAPTKKLVSLRLDRDVLERFRQTGPGWQGRVNKALRASLPLRPLTLSAARKRASKGDWRASS